MACFHSLDDSPGLSHKWNLHHSVGETISFCNTGCLQHEFTEALPQRKPYPNQAVVSPSHFASGTSRPFRASSMPSSLQWTSWLKPGSRAMRGPHWRELGVREGARGKNDQSKRFLTHEVTRSLVFFGGQGLPTVWPRGHWVEGGKEKNLPLWRLQLLISRLVLSCSEPSILTAPGTRWMVVISVPQTRKHWHPTSSLHNQHLTATPVTWTSPLSVLDNHPSGWKLWSSHVTQFWVTLDLGTWLASLSSRLAKMKLNGMVNHYCWSHHFRLPRDIAISGACLASPGILMLFHL